MSTHFVSTWHDELGRLEALLGELGPNTREALRRGGGARRHQDRVHHVLDRALASRLPEGWPAIGRATSPDMSSYGDDPRGVVFALGAGSQASAARINEVTAMIEAAYDECRLVMYDPARERPGWGAGLGKGRRRATDGAAWSAALEEASEKLSLVLGRLAPGRERERGLLATCERAVTRPDWVSAATRIAQGELSSDILSSLESMASCSGYTVDEWRRWVAIADAS